MATVSAEKRQRCPLRPRNRSVPYTILCKGVAERVPFASEVQARGRGSTRHPDATIAAGSGARAGVQSKPRAPGARPMRSYAFTDAVRPSSPSALRRLTPCAASEASGSPARLTIGEETGASQTPCGVATCQRPRQPAYEPEPLRPCLCHTFSLYGRDASGPPDWRVTTARPLRKTPM
jgi:hypothetical protein